MKTGGLNLLAPEAEQRDYRDAVRDVMPILMAVVPFAGLFGALAAERGLPLDQIMLISASVYAGASQYAMLDLMGQKIPAWSIVLTVFAINFRHVLYSASLGRKLHRFSLVQKVAAFFFLVDPLYAAAEARSRKTTLTAGYYFFYSFIIFSVWILSNLAGAIFGRLIEDPEKFGFDFILPIYFVGLVMAFRNSSNFIIVLLCSVGTSLFVWSTLGSPWHISIGGLVGLGVAAALSKPGEPQTTDGDNDQGDADV